MQSFQPCPTGAALATPSRRRVLGLLAAPALLPGLALAQQAAPAQEALRRAWESFRQAFMTAEGRVLDSGNGNISHTEGQGWAMLTAVRADDRPSFERLLDWTRRVLKRRGDMLHAWRFQPGAPNPVADQNNATDGDLCIAWALLEAGKRWNLAEHSALGTAIGRDILKLLVKRIAGQTVLLPGTRGFEKRDHVVLNPSYYVFPAFRALAQAVPDPAWVRLAADGLALLRTARFGRWSLPPDWVALARSDAALSLPTSFPPRFSYDAVRVPLYLAWSRLGQEPAITGAAGFWLDPAHPYLPAWTDLTSNAVSPYPASPGIAAVAQLAAVQRGGSGLPARVLQATAQPPDYYSAALALLVNLALRENGSAAA